MVAPRFFCSFSAAAPAAPGDPFSYVKVSGKVTYEDGTPIPSPDVLVRFYSETEAIGNKQPRPGWSMVDKKTGEFGCPTSHTAFDGLVRGKHKVTFTGTSGVSPLPASLVPPEYGDPKKTPLEVDTDNPDSFILKVRKPTGHPLTTPAPARHR